MRLQNYDEAVQLLLPKLANYLQSKGIETSGLFRCLSPHHEDKNPSCGITPNGEAWNCFACGATGTIFNACSILENKPSTGPEFVHDTLAYLADMYEVPLKKEEPTEEELYRIDTYKAYRIAGELIVNGTPSKIFEEAIEARGWNKELCRELGIGFVNSFKEFKDNLRGIGGFSQKFLGDVDLNRETIFGPNCLIFTIRDEYGSPVGFASRDLNYNNEGSKYVNQKGTGVKCNIYQKSKRLFGFDRFLRKRGKKSHPLFIFEGYSDVATAAEHGLWNCCAVGGTALTTEHIHLLKSKNIYDLVLCLDGDDAGQEATARLLDNILAGHKDLNVKIVIIPGGMDPDEFIRKESIQKFRRLKKHSAFEWRLGKFEEDADPEDMCKKMIQIIVNERSYINQEKMAHELAEATGFTVKTIQKELDRLQNLRAAEKARDIENVGQKLIHEFGKDPQNLHHLIREADLSLYDLSRKYEEDALSVESMVSRIRGQKEHEENLDGSFSGFILGPTMSEMEKALAGEWKKDVWMIVGGKPNSGKTSLMCKLAYEIATHEEENNALVIYHTIDDTFQQVLPKFIALASDSNKLELNMITNPNYAVRNTADHANEISEGREDGYNQIIDLCTRGRLIIKDTEDGLSLAFAENMIRRYKETYPDRNIVYILDNFHKLEDYQNGKGDERVRFKTLSKAMKGMATKYHIPVITTVEYRKIPKGQRPTNDDLLESGQIEYDTNLIAHVFNESHELLGAATTVHRGLNDEKLPIIELEITKNKICSYKGTLFFQFWPSSSRFMETNAIMVQHYRKVEKEKLEEDDTVHKEMFIRISKEVIGKGMKVSKVAFDMAKELGWDQKNNPEENQKMWDLYNKFGGDNGVLKAANS